MRFDTQQFISDALALAASSTPIPWEHQGRNPLTGLDCIGLPRYLYELQGLRLPEELERHFDAYHRKPDGWAMLEIMRRWFLEIATHDQQQLNAVEGYQPGDLIVMYWKRNPCHLGVLVSVTECVEAFKKGGFAKVRQGEPRLPIAAIFRIPEFT